MVSIIQYSLIFRFSGGEPFIVKKGKFLGEMVKFCKDDLRMESVTIVSNGSLITRVNLDM